MVEGGGVGLLPALCLRLMAWVLLTLLTDSCLSASSGAIAGEKVIPYIRNLHYNVIIQNDAKCVVTMVTCY